jgi:proteic killer suppression protein
VAIKNFFDKTTEGICHGRVSKSSRKRLPVELHQKARIRLATLAAAVSLNDLSEIRSNRLESLKGDRKGQFSIRINDQYRICFRWQDNEAVDVEIVDYH